MQVYELITCVRRANENAGNLISVVQFLINIYIYTYYFILNIEKRKKVGAVIYGKNNAHCGYKNYKQSHSLKLFAICHVLLSFICLSPQCAFFISLIKLIWHKKKNFLFQRCLFLEVSLIHGRCGTFFPQHRFC